MHAMIPHSLPYNIERVRARLHKQDNGFFANHSRAQQVSHLMLAFRCCILCLHSLVFVSLSILSPDRSNTKSQKVHPLAHSFRIQDNTIKYNTNKQDLRHLPPSIFTLCFMFCFYPLCEHPLFHSILINTPSMYPSFPLLFSCSSPLKSHSTSFSYNSNPYTQHFSLTFNHHLIQNEVPFDCCFLGHRHPFGRLCPPHALLHF